MEVLKIESSEELPGVILNKNTGELIIWGRSIPRNAANFYRSIIEWMDLYSSSPNTETNFQFKLDYFNTLSHKYVADIFKILERMNSEGAKIQVTWFYQADDDDMKQIGQEFEAFLNLQFVFTEY